MVNHTTAEKEGGLLPTPAAAWLSFKNKQKTNMAFCGISRWKATLPMISSTFSKFSKPIHINNSIIIKRQFSATFPRFCQNVNEDPGLCTEEHDRTIYEGILATQVKMVKGFSLTTSIIGMCSQPLLMMQMQQNNANLAIMVGAGSFMSLFIFITPIMIHHISKKYVTELNYNKLEDTYTAYYYSLFLRKKEVIFANPHEQEILPWSYFVKQSNYKMEQLNQEQKLYIRTHKYIQ